MRQSFQHLTTVVLGCSLAGMNYFLLCVEKPKHGHDEKGWIFWSVVSTHIEKITKPVAGVQKLCENVWLIPVTKGVDALAESIQICRSQGQKYQAIFVQAEPESFDETAKTGETH